MSDLPASVENVYEGPRVPLGDPEGDDRPIEDLERVAVGFKTRALARIADMVYVFLVGFVASFGAGIAFTVMTSAGSLAPGWETRLKGNFLSDFLFGALANLGYHTLCEGLHGSTVGKRLLGIQAVTETGRPCSIASALLRSLAYYVDAFFFGWIAAEAMKSSSLKQRHGDRWAHTVVIPISEARGPAARTGGTFVSAVVAGSIAVAVAQTAMLLFRVL